MPKSAIGPLLLLALTVIGVWGREVLDARLAKLPSCPIRQATGWPCPACGGRHAISSLLHGHFQDALRWNPLVVALVAGLGAWLALGRRMPLQGLRGWMFVILGVVLFWVLRQFPPLHGWLWT